MTNVLLKLDFWKLNQLKTEYEGLYICDLEWKPEDLGSLGRCLFCFFVNPALLSYPSKHITVGYTPDWLPSVKTSENPSS